MTEPGAELQTVPDQGDALARLCEGQEALRQDFEQLMDGFQRLAAAVTPLLAKQHQDTERRMRVMETRLRTRQERPLIVRMANLLADVRRLDSAQDVKVHVEDTMLEALTSMGYQEMGSPGDTFDPGYHEPVSGALGKAGAVTRVHRRGLACYGDVIIKAMVDVEPAATDETEQGELGA
jgi:molecular chaperone GrpE (heat shock protein)